MPVISEAIKNTAFMAEVSDPKPEFLWPLNTQKEIRNIKTDAWIES